MSNTSLAKTKIVRTTSEPFQVSPALRAWADRQNIPEVSKAINILTRYELRDGTDLQNKCQILFMKKGTLAAGLNTIQTQINDLDEKIKTIKGFHKYKGFYAGLNKLDGRKRKKYEKKYSHELSEYHKYAEILKGFYPDRHLPAVEHLTKQHEELIQERNSKNSEYNKVKSQLNELNKARQTLSDYLNNEREVNQQKKKKQALE